MTTRNYSHWKLVTITEHCESMKYNEIPQTACGCRGSGGFLDAQWGEAAGAGPPMRDHFCFENQ